MAASAPATLLPVVLQDLLLALLRRIDVCALAACSKDLSVQCRAVLNHPCAECAPRLLLVSSANNKLIELSVNVEDGQMAVLHDTEVRCRATGGSVTKRNSGMWPTYAAFAPDGVLYVAQYQGSRILRFSGATLARRSTAISASKLQSPEGVAFAHGCMYVASAEHRTINKLVRASDGEWKVHKDALHLRLELTPDSKCQDMVPWGVIAGPPQKSADQSSVDPCTSSPAACHGVTSALYVAVAEEYYTADYYNLTEVGAGCIAVVQLAADGAMTGCSRFGPATLKRPTGLCFDANGNLWVSSMEKQLVCLAGPSSATPGIVLEQVSTVSACQDGLPWDVHCVGELLVTPLHSGKKHPCCVASFIRRKGTDGNLAWQQAHTLQHKLFREPNTLCLQR